MRRRFAKLPLRWTPGLSTWSRALALAITYALSWIVCLTIDQSLSRSRSSSLPFVPLDSTSSTADGLAGSLAERGSVLSAARRDRVKSTTLASGSDLGDSPVSLDVAGARLSRSSMESESDPPTRRSSRRISLILVIGFLVYTILALHVGRILFLRAIVKERDR